MSEFETKTLPGEPTVLAPDGSEVRILLGLPRGGMAQFRLAPAQVARAVSHRTVEDIWYVTEGRGRIWRRAGGREEVTELYPGLCLTIPLGTHFQFRAEADSALAVIGVTMPPWPGPDESFEVDGPWAASA